MCVLLALAVTVGCSRRGREKTARRETPSARPDGGLATSSARPPAPPPLPPALPETTPPPGPATHRGGSLRVHLEAEPPHLDPLLDTVQVIDRVVGGLVYETLLECRGDQHLPLLADTFDVASDGTRLLVHLRPDARWQNDKVLSGLDVQATFEYLMRSPNRSPVLHTMVGDVEGVDLLPERMVRFRLTRPSGLTLRALCEIPILPAEPLRGGGTHLTQLRRMPQGTGPFRVAAWERGKRIKLVRNRPTHAARSPKLDEIIFEIDSDAARALTRLRRGEFDVLPRVSEAHYPEQVSPAILRDVFDLYLLAPHRYSFVALNTRRGALGNPAFRHALSLLWDRVRFASEFHHGLARPVGAPTFGTAPADKFDRSLAGRLLDEAGFHDTNADGVREVGGAPLRLVFLVPAGSRTLAGEVRAFALDLRRAGILLDTSSLDAAALFARVERGDFDMSALTWDGRKDEDVRLILTRGGDFQYTGYRPEGFSSLIDLLRAAPSPAGRAPLLQELAGLLAADRPALFLYRHDVPVLVAKRVHGLAAVGDRLDLRGVWVDP